MGDNLRKPLTICNIYRPPHDDDSNDNISNFLFELSPPILGILQKENTHVVVVGDFNINLLQINGREKFEDFFALMWTNSFYPMITLPTLFSKHSCSLLHKMFCKLHTKITKIFNLLLLRAVYRIIFCALLKSTFYVRVTSLQNIFTFIRRMIQPLTTFEAISQKLTLPQLLFQTWRPIRTLHMRSLSGLSRLLMRNTSPNNVWNSINIQKNLTGFRRISR